MDELRGAGRSLTSGINLPVRGRSAGCHAHGRGGVGQSLVAPSVAARSLATIDASVTLAHQDQTREREPEALGAAGQAPVPSVHDAGPVRGVGLGEPPSKGDRAGGEEVLVQLRSQAGSRLRALPTMWAKLGRIRTASSQFRAGCRGKGRASTAVVMTLAGPPESVATSASLPTSASTAISTCSRIAALRTDTLSCARGSRTQTSDPTTPPWTRRPPRHQPGYATTLNCRGEQRCSGSPTFPLTSTDPVVYLACVADRRRRVPEAAQRWRRPRPVP